MSDTLRDRIAKAIAGAVYGHNTLETDWADLHEDAQDEYFAEADAVITELGLQTNLAKRIINGKPDQWVRRHVTDWEIVDDLRTQNGWDTRFPGAWKARLPWPNRGADDE